LEVTEILFTFAVFSYRSPACERCWRGWGPIYRKSVIWRFVLDTQESGSSKLIVETQSNNDAHGYVLSITV